MAVFDAATAVLSAAALPATALRPHSESLFVAWNGVLALVYDGFPPPMALAKDRLGTLSGMQPEKFGSKWPKTTLGAELDGSAPLTLAELQLLREVCRTHSAAIAALAVEVMVPSISVVEYECRGLEKLQRRADVPLAVDQASAAPPSAEEQARVAGVLAEWGVLEEYLPKVNAPGSRIRSYREDSPHGITCVSFLQPMPEALSGCLAAFRDAVDEALPGRYVWLEESSLHCTLRSLD